jgi:enoyl-CoA hydratase/carnithine racemase
MQASNENKVLFEYKASNKLGIVTLNRPSALNAADLEMTSSIRKEWRTWEKSDSVGAVILRSSGERAFCSGGDVKALAAAITREPDSKLPERALASEYLLLSEMSNSRIFKIAVIDGAAPLLSLEPCGRL